MKRHKGLDGARRGRYRGLVIALCLSSLILLGVPLRASGFEVVMALDTSGSMRQNDPRRLLPEAARLFISLVRPEDCLGMLTFDDGATVRLSLLPMDKPQYRRALAALRKLSPRGLYTDFYAALAEGLQAFPKEDQAPGRALLLLTDGQMDINPKKGESAQFLARLRQELVPQYQQRNIAIYTVAFSEQSDQAFLKELAAQTGGRFLPIHRAADLHLAFATIYEELEHPQLAPITGDRFLIDATVQEATLIISRAQAKQAATLIRPSGKKISFKTARPPIRWFAAEVFDLVTIPHPEPGVWHLQGQKERGNRVILLTDLKLHCPFLPFEAGQDEEVLIAAGLHQNQKLVTAKPLLETTTFTATLEGPENKQKFACTLSPPEPGLPGSWEAGLRVGRFSPLRTLGTWNLRIQALGRTFQREQHFRLTVIPPWFVPRRQPLKPDGQIIVDYQAAADRQATGLEGWISVKKPSGQIQAIKVQLGAAADFGFDFSPPVPGLYRVTMQLSGTTKGGRPLLIRSAAFPVTVPASSRPASNAPESGPPPKPAEGRRWLIPALAGGVALAVLVILYLWRRPRLRSLWRRSPAPAASAREPIAISEEAAQPIEKENLLLKAQVESLKAQLNRIEADNQDLHDILRALQRERAEEQQKIKRQLEHYQKQTRLVQQLEDRLQKAEEETRAMQEEYMALFSRTQQDKEVLKKG